MSKTHLLNVESLCKSYRGEDGPVDVLRGASFTLDAGQTVALTGESGSGKSTALHLIGGLDVPDSGKVLIDGVDLASLGDSGRARVRRERIGVVFQQFNLIPSLCVGDNIAFQSRLAGRYDATWCAALSDRLGLIKHLRKFPEQLSGGQQQRVAIGRALAHRPALLLADEPTGNLDQATGDSVLALMLELVAETGAGLLMVTHSDRLAGQMSRRLHLSAGALA